LNPITKRHAHVTFLPALLLLAFSAALLHPYFHDPGSRDAAHCRICLVQPGWKPAPTPPVLQAPTALFFLQTQLADQPEQGTSRIITAPGARDPPLRV